MKKFRGDTIGHACRRELRTFFEWNGELTEASFDPPPSGLVNAVHQEMARLRAKPGVAAAERAVLSSHRALVARYQARHKLASVYRKLAAGYGVEHLAAGYSDPIIRPPYWKVPKRAIGRLLKG